MKRILRFLVFSCFFLFGIGVSHGQVLQFEQFSSEFGLSQNMVLSMLQDKKGFLWVGTSDGLNRFDGYRFKTYRFDPFDSLSITGNEVKSILEDRYNRMWVVTDQGINLFDREKEVFYFHKQATSASHLTEDPDGNLWLGIGEGLVKISLPAKSRTLEGIQISLVTNKNQVSVNSKSFSSPVWDAKGHAFVGNADNHIFHLQPDKSRQNFSLDWQFPFVSDTGFRRELEQPKVLQGQSSFTNVVEPGRQGNVWFGYPNELARWDARTGSILKMPVPDRKSVV